MPVLEINNLVVDFETDQGVVEAIDHLTVSVRAGEILGVVGESGCGKTTVARSVLGVIPQPPARLRNGEIRFQGEDLLRMSEAELTARIRGKAVMVIPHDPLASLNPLFPVGVQLRDLLKWSGQSGAAASTRAIQAHLVSLLQAVQLPLPEAQLRKYPHEFSGGQRQRLLIAAALAPDPALIIADEPTSALDVTVQAQILLLLRALVKERGTSVFLISHDLGIVRLMGHRVSVMYLGVIAESGPTEAIFQSPAHPYTQALLAAAPKPEVGPWEGTLIQGEPPRPGDMPSGCRFCLRCSLAQPDPCAHLEPALQKVYERAGFRHGAGISRDRTKFRQGSREAIRDMSAWSIGSAAAQGCSRLRRYSYCSQAKSPEAHRECPPNPIYRYGHHCVVALPALDEGTARCRRS